MSSWIRTVLASGLLVLVAACGGGGSSGSGPSTDGGGSTPSTTFVLGSGSGSTFAAGALNIEVAELSAGGTTGVTVSLADESGNLFTGSASVAFNSSCAVDHLATITSPVTVTNGVATSTYTATGCEGDDTITASVTVNAIASTATGTVTVAPAVIGSLEFVSANPETIGIRGFGLTEVSRVSFRVRDTNGNPVPNQLVNFALNISGSGLTLSDTSATSGADGVVSVDVRAGTAHTSVRVTATLASDPTIQTQSNALVVSTGVADQDSVSVGAKTINPAGGACETDGVEDTVTIRAADHFNNPVPDGTAIAFTTEGGQIQPQCLTSGGACTVTWTSSNPRPDDGDVTILATLLGEESFFDAESDGVLDANDTFDDKEEAFRDDNLNGVFDAGEPSVDFNSNGSHDAADGEYNGVLCCDAAAVAGSSAGDACFGHTPTSLVCSTVKNIHARGIAHIQLSSETNITVVPAVAAASVTAGSANSVTVSVSVFGTCGAAAVAPPKGTTVTVTTDNGVILEPQAALTVPGNLTGPYVFTVNVKGDGVANVGDITIEAKTPSGDGIDTASIHFTD